MKKHIAKTLVTLTLAFLLPAICIGAEVIEKDLGVRNASFSSTGQALAMLSLINEKPHHLKYQISYKTEVDQVVFEYDAGMDSITRIRKQKDGTGTLEKLPGEAMYRLQTAAKGGSLFDTRKGKSVGTVENF
ncbi:MAG: hypothetical protein KJ630_16720 [Proteobacteria bacterium]|nr:hypothetical protein [Pseudomonadota bacterium]